MTAPEPPPKRVEPLPSLDDYPTFAAVLDPGVGGAITLAQADAFIVERHYVRDSNGGTTHQLRRASRFLNLWRRGPRGVAWGNATGPFGCNANNAGAGTGEGNASARVGHHVSVGAERPRCGSLVTVAKMPPPGGWWSGHRLTDPHVGTEPDRGAGEQRRWRGEDGRRDETGQRR